MEELKYPKQEAFARAVALEKMSQHQAYVLAYNTKNFKASSIDVNSSKLASNTKVKLRIAYLKSIITDKVIEKFVYDKEKSFKKLEKIQGIALTQERPDLCNYLKAEDLIQKIFGLQKSLMELTMKEKPVIFDDIKEMEVIKEIEKE